MRIGVEDYSTPAKVVMERDSHKFKKEYSNDSVDAGIESEDEEEVKEEAKSLKEPKSTLTLDMI